MTYPVIWVKSGNATQEERLALVASRRIVIKSIRPMIRAAFARPAPGAVGGKWRFHERLYIGAEDQLYAGEGSIVIDRMATHITLPCRKARYGDQVVAPPTHIRDLGGL